MEGGIEKRHARSTLVSKYTLSYLLPNKFSYAHNAHSSLWVVFVDPDLVFFFFLILFFF